MILRLDLLDRLIQFGKRSISSLEAEGGREGKRSGYEEPLVAVAESHQQQGDTKTLMGVVKEAGSL